MTDDRDPYWDYDDHECANCGGEGYVYGCSWDWQCDTYDEGEGTCLCSRRCDWCNPAPRNPELQQILADALALARDSDAMLGTKPEGLSPEGVAARAAESGIAHNPLKLGEPS